VGRGNMNFNSRFFKGQYFCKSESNAEGKKSDTQHIEDFKKDNFYWPITAIL
jgi:hypothetical protein